MKKYFIYMYITGTFEEILLEDFENLKETCHKVVMFPDHEDPDTFYILGVIPHKQQDLNKKVITLAPMSQAVRNSLK